MILSAAMILSSIKQYLRSVILFAFILGIVACSSKQRANVSVGAVALTAAQKEAQPTSSREGSANKEQKKAHSSQATPSKDEVAILNEAERQYALAKGHYREGKYHQSEKILKECLLLNPFLAKANLLLGKLFLLRSAGSKDKSLLESAKFMFEMALRNDPTLREAQTLLGLFKKGIP